LPRQMRNDLISDAACVAPHTCRVHAHGAPLTDSPKCAAV
jgi:hypothetical protein